MSNTQGRRSTRRRRGTNPISIAIAIVIASSAIAVAILIVGQPATAQGQQATPSTVVIDAYFTTAEEVMPLGRTVATDKPVLEGAMNALLEGPTAEERAQGYGTDIPEGTTLLSATVDPQQSRAVIDLSAEFEQLDTNDSESATWEERGRVVQVVLTAQNVANVDTVDILIDGKPHAATSTNQIEQPATPEPVVSTPAPQTSVANVATIRQAQEKLVQLKYLPEGAVTGVRDYRTEQAVMAFQAWEGLQRDGDVGPQTTAALSTASPPVPKDEGISGKSVQIYRDKGVVLLVTDGQLARAVHTSTGGPGHTTPAGKYKIYSKEIKHWSRQYSVWLPYCQFFYAGYALHEYQSVPAQPASHGCARLPSPEAPEVWEFTDTGTPVTVY